jgi:hypothetical protein
VRREEGEKSRNLMITDDYYYKAAIQNLTYGYEKEIIAREWGRVVGITCKEGDTLNAALD